MEALVLAANPGSASRKYGLYTHNKRLAELQFEHKENGRIVCELVVGGKTTVLYPDISHLDNATEQVVPILQTAGIADKSQITRIGLRVVAPSSYFMRDRQLNDEVLAKLGLLRDRVPLHIKATLQEALRLRQHFAGIPIILVSDSAFHITKPDYAWNYAIPLKDAERLEIKRFGYHGISVASIVRQLSDKKKLPKKLIVCHLGSGASVTAVLNGKSLDTTMGYSPLEGLMMATRSGAIDPVAVMALKNELGFDDIKIEAYLNEDTGLKGVSGISPDLRELLEAEKAGQYNAMLALRMYVYKIQQAIGQMAASLNGVDALVFTGTVGDRSSVIRQRVAKNLEHLRLAVQDSINKRTFEPVKIVRISSRKRHKPVYVITTDEDHEIARRALAYLKSNT